MKIASLVFVVPLAGCGVVDVISKVSVGSGPRVIGTGKPISQSRKAQAVTGVQASGAMVVQIRKGAPKLVVEAQKEILKQLRTEYRGGRLVMWTEGNTTSNYPVRVWYTGPNVSSLEGSGATEFDATGLNGSPSSISLSGASKVKATGRVGKLSVEASGASEANLRQLESQDATVEASGASKIRVWATHSLDASASGASEVRHRMPVSGPIHAKASGASTVKPE